MGGQLTSGIKRLTATSKGATYSFGTETKIKILKNHLDAPHNVCYEGKMIATDVGFISPDDLETYKKEHISQILTELNKLNKEGGEYEVNIVKPITYGSLEKFIKQQNKYHIGK